MRITPYLGNVEGICAYEGLPEVTVNTKSDRTSAGQSRPPVRKRPSTKLTESIRDFTQL
jgi:hypothetical protein